MAQRGGISVKHYFKITNDAILGVGFVYYEFTDELCTRQIYQDGESWLSYERRMEDTWNRDNWWYYKPKEDSPNRHICDQRLSVMGFYVSDEISEQEFETAWQKSIHA